MSVPAGHFVRGPSSVHRLLSVLSMVRYRFFLYAGLLPYGLGAAWAYATTGSLDAPIFWSGLGGVVLAVIGVEAFNEYFDSRMGTDRVFNAEDRAADVELGLDFGDGRIRRSAGGRHLPRCPRGMADFPVCPARRVGRHLLRGASHPMGVPRPGRAGHRTVVWTVDGARQRLSVHRQGFVGRAVGVAGAGVPHHGARGGQRDTRLPPRPPRRKAQPGGTARATARRLALLGAGERGAGGCAGRRRRERISSRVPHRALRHCRFSCPARAARFTPSRRRACSCLRSAVSSPATALR